VKVPFVTASGMIGHFRAWHLSKALLGIVVAAGLGQVATAQSGDKAAASARQADFYRPEDVQSIYLTVSDKNMQRLLAALPERIYVPAAFRWRDVSIDDVAIRFKGNSSSAPGQKHKRSFLIKFDEYVDDVRFLGLRRVSFDNAIQFGSLFAEPVITEILRDQGIKTHRCNYSKLYLNDKYQGVYVNVERIDETFIERNYPDPNGLLFKVDEGGPGGNLQFIGDDPVLYSKAFEPETKSAKKGQKQLVEFLRLINESAPDEFAKKLEATMAVDDFLRLTAVLLLSGAFDQLTGWNPHNYYLLRDAKQERWHYLPWDLDVGFCEVAFGHIQVLTDWNAAWPAAGQLPNPLMDRIVANPELLQRYRSTARMILDKYFEPDRLCAVIDAKYKLIKADLQSDPFPHQRITNPEDRSYDDIVASLKRFVRLRHASARQQLENPGKRPAMSQQPHGPPPQLIAKIQRIQQAAEQMQRNGQDISPIRNVMERVGPLLQKGQMAEAEKLIGEALKLAGVTGEAPPQK